jgi:hypothetical protein
VLGVEFVILIFDTRVPFLGTDRKTGLADLGEGPDRLGKVAGHPGSVSHGNCPQVAQNVLPKQPLQSARFSLQLSCLVPVSVNP